MSSKMSLNEEPEYGNPEIVFVLSGKRKSGKDYIANLLLERYGSDKAVIIRLSGPLKERYALENNLDYKKLLDATEYKERHRKKMIQWGEDIRNKDPSYFCRHAIVQSNAKCFPVWIVSDARRTTDMEFFLKHFKTRTRCVRINASDEVRMKRGWKFTAGVDDCESECGLDGFNKWDFVVNNNEDEALNSINIMSDVKIASEK